MAISDYHRQVEEHFQSIRVSEHFLLSTKDWALISQWKSNGIPLVCVLRGLDAAFRAYHGRRQRAENINSVSFCSREVISEWRKSVGMERKSA